MKRYFLLSLLSTYLVLYLAYDFIETKHQSIEPKISNSPNIVSLLEVTFMRFQNVCNMFSTTQTDIISST